MPFAFRGELKGLRPTLQRLSSLKSGASRRILRKALGKASQLVAQGAKAHVRVSSGLLRKSLGRKVKVYRQSGVVVAIIGPRTGYKAAIEREGRRILANPIKYAHLVELGSKRSQAFPFLQPAWTGKQAEIVEVIKEVVLAEINKQGNV